MSTIINTNDECCAIEIYRRLWGTEHYETTSDGKVRNSKTGHILKHSINKKGEAYVTILNSYYRTRPVKRVIYDAWGI